MIFCVYEVLMILGISYGVWSIGGILVVSRWFSFVGCWNLSAEMGSNHSG